MRTMQVIAGLCVLVAAAAVPLRAQVAAGHGKDTTHATMHAAGGEMASHHTQMMRLQKSAITAATRCEQLAGGKRLARKAILTHATRARTDLRAVMNHLDAAEKIAKPEEKGVISQVRAHEQEALKHADELVEAAKKPDAKGPELEAHAKAVVEHATAAQTVITSHQAAHT